MSSNDSRKKVVFLKMSRGFFWRKKTFFIAFGDSSGLQDVNKKIYKRRRGPPLCHQMSHWEVGSKISQKSVTHC